MLFGVTERPRRAEINGKNKLVVEACVENGTDSDEITTATFHLPLGDFSNVHPITKSSIINDVFFIELQGFLITNPSPPHLPHTGLALDDAASHSFHAQVIPCCVLLCYLFHLVASLRLS